MGGILPPMRFPFLLKCLAVLLALTAPTLWAGGSPLGGDAARGKTASGIFLLAAGFDLGPETPKSQTASRILEIPGKKCGGGLDPVNNWDPTGLFTMPGMYEEFFKKYGEQGAHLLNMAAMKGYTVKSASYTYNSWSIESDNSIGINYKTALGSIRSDEDAAERLMSALGEVYKNEVQMPALISTLADANGGNYGGFGLYYYTIGKEIGYTSVAEGAYGYDAMNQTDLSGGQRALYMGVGTAQGVLTLAPAGGLAKGFAGRMSGNLGRVAAFDVTLGSGRYLTQLGTKMALRSMEAVLNNRLGAAASAAFNKIMTRTGLVKGSELMLPHEKAFADELAAQGSIVEAIPRVGNQRTADFFINGVRTEFKRVTGAARAIKNRLQKAVGQVGRGDEIMIDARAIDGLTKEEALRQIEGAAGNEALLRDITITVITQGGVIVRTAGQRAVWMPAAMGVGSSIPDPGDEP